MNGKALLLFGNETLLPCNLFDLICLDYFGGRLFPAAVISLVLKKCNKDMQIYFWLSLSRCDFLLL